MTERVSAYIDGFNLYFGLREKGWKWAYWLDLPALMRSFLKPGQALACTKYFTSIVETPVSKHKRQATFLDALRMLPDLGIHYGHFLSDEVKCQRCGHVYTTHHEKMTDVNIATEMLLDAVQDSFDVALLVSADSDLVGPVRRIRKLRPEKKIIAVFPPGRFSNELKRYTDGYVYIGPDKLSKCLFPEEITKPDGFVLRRPASWK